MHPCEIVQIARSSRWKWRSVATDGAVTESAQTYTFHYECAFAARAAGFRPVAKWTVEE
jgi:hypothetical protein